VRQSGKQRRVSRQERTPTLTWCAAGWGTLCGACRTRAASVFVHDVALPSALLGLVGCDPAIDLAGFGEIEQSVLQDATQFEIYCAHAERMPRTCSAAGTALAAHCFPACLLSCHLAVLSPQVRQLKEMGQMMLEAHKARIGGDAMMWKGRAMSKAANVRVGLGVWSAWQAPVLCCAAHVACVSANSV
jgi:hypothetical protein